MDLIPDSSFFICFFDDLSEFIDNNKLDSYFSVFSFNFDIQVTGLVNREITKTDYPIYNNHHSKFNVVNLDNLLLNDGYLLELLRPIVGRGEYEVISLAKQYHEHESDDFIFILDDNQARTRISSYLPELNKYLKGTVGLVMFCCLDLELFNKDSSIHILNCINDSKFFVDSNIIENVIQTIQSS
jgi:predicted nucleic acid-binding protein